MNLQEEEEEDVQDNNVNQHDLNAQDGIDANQDNLQQVNDVRTGKTLFSFSLFFWAQWMRIYIYTI